MRLVHAAHAVDRDVLHQQLRFNQLVGGPIPIGWLLERLGVRLGWSRDCALHRLS